MKKNITHTFDLTPTDNHRLANLCGPLDEYLRQIERHTAVSIQNRAHHFQITGSPEAVQKTEMILKQLYAQAEKTLTPDRIHLYLHESRHFNMQQTHAMTTEEITITTKHAPIKPHSPNQANYVKNIMTHDVNFGVGPAGTGKTYLAVASAVSALEKQQVSRILLVRPAIEAGEKLGFLPGDLTQKVDPYFRPLYDALYEMLGFDSVHRLIDHHVIEIAPLAYMRGRTLNDSFIILDEGQNTTKEQMKMFLTRIGFNSKVVITGDITQTDLPKNIESGLKHCLNVLKDIEGISVNLFQPSDVVRHPLVQHILEAYDQHENKNSS